MGGSANRGKLSIGVSIQGEPPLTTDGWMVYFLFASIAVALVLLTAVIGRWGMGQSYPASEAWLLNALCASCALRPLLVRRGPVPLLIPNPEYSFLDLSIETVGHVNNARVSPYATVRLIRSLWHLNERLLAFRLNDLDVRNANEVANIHRHKTSK